MDQTSTYITPLASSLLADDNDVSRDDQIAQRSAQLYGLDAWVLDLRLDHEEVKVAVLPGFAPCMGSEQDYA